MKKLILLFITLLSTGTLASEVAGTWVCKVPNEDGGLDEYALIIAPLVDQKIEAKFISFENYGKLKGQANPGEAIQLKGESAAGFAVEIHMTINGEQLKGQLHIPSLKLTLPISGTRSDIAGVAAIGMQEVHVKALQPASIHQRGLPEKLEKQVEARLAKAMETWQIVGLSSGIIRGDEMVDIRSYGWEDFKAKVPASATTMYRWASIAKPLTAIVAMQLAKAGALELDRDIHHYVPEYPKQPFAITTRQLLNHTAGMVHYQPGKVIPTPRKYQQPHPFGDVILALDHFNGSELLFEPGTQFSYSTPGYVLLGAVLQRAGKRNYSQLVKEKIIEPLGLTSLQPDHAWIDIPHRSVGYHKITDTFSGNSVDKEVSWKLPAGGWISNIVDLTQFAQGILQEKLLSKAVFEEMWQPTELSDGKKVNYGWGFNMGERNGMAIVWHSGGQNKTATYMLLCPKAQIGIVLMCNTQGTRHEVLARDLMDMLLGSDL